MSRFHHLEYADMMAGISPEQTRDRLTDGINGFRDESIDQALQCTAIAIESHDMERNMLPGCFVSIAANPSIRGFFRVRPIQPQQDGGGDVMAWNSTIPFLNGLGLSLRECRYECYRDPGFCRICGRFSMLCYGYCNICGELPAEEVRE